MNKKSIIIIISFVFIVGVATYFYKKSLDDPKYNGLSEAEKLTVKQSGSTEKFYWDEVYYHRDKYCKNHRGFISMDKISKVSLLADSKKPCPVCIPEEQGGK